MTHRIGLLIFDDFQLLDAAGPLSAFGIAERYRPGAYALTVLAKSGGEVASSCGVTMGARAVAEAGPFDTLIVSGGDGTRRAFRDPELLDFLRDMAPRVARLASVCSGAFLLAEAGRLDGKRATTHWARTSDFAARYPKVKLDPDRIFIRDGNVWTSAGITAGIDLALAMISEDLGEPIARQTAQQLVVYRRRPGGQSQFSALLEMERPEGRFAPLLAWARERLGEKLDVETLAERAAMSPRHFTRRFLAETGLSPARAIERLRVESARERVEGSSEPIEGIAEAVGFGDPERMRRAFVKAFGQPPQALRRVARG